MNIKKIFTILFTGSIVLLSACQKDLDQFVPDAGQVTGPDTNWVSGITTTMPVNVLKHNLLMEPYRDSFEVNSTTVTINTPAGLQCIFPPNSCVNAAGAPITGKVYADFQLIKKKGDMIRMDKPTSSDGRLLVSGGEVFVRLTKDGNELHLAQGAIVYLKYNDNPISTSMKFFLGDESNIDRFNWLPSLDSSNRIFPNSIFYTITSNTLRWINCDYFYDTTNTTRVKVQTELPPNFTNANTTVYMVFNDIRSVIGMYGDAVARKFISAKVPVGKPVTIVVISKQGDDYFLGKETTITTLPINGGTIANQNVNVTPVKTPLTDIKTYLGTF